MFATIAGIVSSLAVIVAVIELLRRQRLRERHAFLWVGFGIGALVFAAFPGLLGRVSEALGIAVPSNLVFFVALVTIFLVALQQSAELTRLEHKVRDMAEAIALLDHRVPPEAPPAQPQAGGAAEGDS